jgi:CBS domain containing-hemolysin-like protein
LSAVLAIWPDHEFWVHVLGIVSIPSIILLNAFFVAAEFSLVAVRKTRVEELMNNGVRGARAVHGAISSLDRYIAATQLGITLTSLGLGWLGEPAIADLLRPLFQKVPLLDNRIAVHSAATGTAFLLITFLHVVFGEFVPKSLALDSPDRFALWVAQPLIVFEKLSQPLIILIRGTGNAILRWLSVTPMHGEQALHTVEELLLLIEDTEEAGLLDPDQAEFAQNVFRLSGKQVSDCMVARDKMSALEVATPPEEILAVVRQTAHTRMPVFEGQLDHIVGIVNTKDLFYLFSLRGFVVLEDALYPALFLKPDASVAMALKLFKSSKRPMALVRDDENHILGLITLEDILEEIVGDIEDEHDRRPPKVKRRFNRPSARPGKLMPDMRGLIGSPKPGKPTGS